ncbi:MAG: hypothetical protein GXC72_12275 [Chitinophagaceae bacterium]|jgi:hypothetical protein|nr:hypothetical protein [Chitinophagaceae bacterium]
MKTYKSRHVLLMAMLCPLIAVSQQSAESTDTKNEVTASINYQSALHFFGRTDSLRSSGWFPMLGFQLKNGLYAQSNIVFVQNRAQPLTYAGTVVEAGYRFPKSDHFTGNLFFSRMLYRDESTLVQSALKSQTGVNMSYTNKILNINGGLDLKFSNQTDVGVTLGVDHLFLIPTATPGTAFALAPAAYAYLGTQRFSNTYLEKKNVLGIPVTQQTTENVTQLNVLSYEISMPLVFVKGKFNAAVTPAYVIPQNLVTVPGRADLSERGKKMLYVTISAGIRL